ncbi:stage II sporulation protein M [Caldanaerobacter sp.]|uniref:stage II sporulation protein M n=1 Tax=Caldanaerobacter sp. TaxID=2930036 RepID=UPI003C732F0F
MKFIKAGFSSHVKGNFSLYILVLTALMIGIVVGTFTVNNITEVQREQIKEYIDKFYQIAKSVELNPVQIFKQSLLNNFVTVFLLWILGATIVGIPFIFLIVGVRGFTLGFSIGIMIKEMQLKGVLLTILGLLPQNIFILLGILFTSVTAINFSLYLLKNKKFFFEELISQFISYSFAVYAGFLFIMLGCLIESYVTPHVLFLPIFSS